jgi:hypothetical protein
MVGPVTLTKTKPTLKIPKREGNAALEISEKSL